MYIMMPKMDGLDTIKKIVNIGLTRNIEIKIITEKVIKNHIKMIGFELYKNDYLSKFLWSGEINIKCK